MAEPYFTLSASSRVSTCPPSAVLPRIGNSNEKAVRGSAGHKLMEIRAEHGYQASVDAIDEVAAEYQLDELNTAMLAKNIREFTWCPPKGAYVETPLALDRKGNVRVIDPECAAPGNYQVTEDEWLAGTVDVAWVDGTVLWVPDFKFGQDKYVAPIASNGQLWNGALMMHRMLEQQGVKVTHLMPAVIFVRPGEPGGIWETLSHPVDVNGVEAQVWRNKLKKLLHTLDGLKAELGAGKSISGFTTSDKCGFCPCIHACPAYAETVRRLVLDPNLQLGTKAEPLSGEELIAAARFFGLVKRAASTLETLLRKHCSEQGPIEIEPGLCYGITKQERSEYVFNDKSFALMQQALGKEKLFELLGISKGSVKEELGNKAQSIGMKKKAVIEGFEADMEKHGAIAKKTLSVLTTYRSDESTIPKAH